MTPPDPGLAALICGLRSAAACLADSDAALGGVATGRRSGAPRAAAAPRSARRSSRLSQIALTAGDSVETSAEGDLMVPNFIRTAGDSKSGVWCGTVWQLGSREQLCARSKSLKPRKGARISAVGLCPSPAPPTWAPKAHPGPYRES